MNPPGTVTVVIDSDENGSPPISDREEGRETVVSWLPSDNHEVFDFHEVNAAPPILRTPSGIDTDVKWRHSEKALSTISSVPDGTA